MLGLGRGTLRIVTAHAPCRAWCVLGGGRRGSLRSGILRDSGSGGLFAIVHLRTNSVAIWHLDLSEGTRRCARRAAAETAASAPERRIAYRFRRRHLVALLRPLALALGLSLGLVLYLGVLRRRLAARLHTSVHAHVSATAHARCGRIGIYPTAAHAVRLNTHVCECTCVPKNTEHQRTCARTRSAEPGRGVERRSPKAVHKPRPALHRLQPRIRWVPVGRVVRTAADSALALAVACPLAAAAALTCGV